MTDLTDSPVSTFFGPPWLDADGYVVPPTDEDGFLLDDLLLSWENQVSQYPATGPGLVYFRGDVNQDVWVDCLLRYEGGELVGILNHYPVDIKPWERRGNVTVWIHPDHRRQGIGQHLLTRAVERWQVDLDAQRYTRPGRALAQAVRAQREAGESRG